MTTQEHYFENLLYHGKDANGEYNKNALSKEVQEAIEICADYVLYTTFNNRDDFKKHNIIKTNDPQGDSWEEYANRLYDLAYKHGASDVLKRIKEDVHNTNQTKYPFTDKSTVYYAKADILKIIDKYMGELE